MRKEASKAREITVFHVDGYHRGDYEQKLIFASDRPTKATDDYKLEKDGSLPSMYGIEIETQNWGITDQTIYANVLKSLPFKNFHKNLFKMEHDISLSDNCDSYAECISQPMTKAYIRNHYRDFKAMYDYFRIIGTSCDKTSDCGMHCHISLTCFGREWKSQEDAIKKFYYIVNRHYDLMLRLLYRNPSVRYYCEQMNFDGIKNWDLETFRNNHNVCINMGHIDEGNIELRLAGGQKNFACFRNTMESIFHLVEVSKSISWKDADDIVKVFSGCNNYVFDRLSTYVKADGLISDSELEKIGRTVIYKEFV